MLDEDAETIKEKQHIRKPINLDLEIYIDKTKYNISSKKDKNIP